MPLLTEADPTVAGGRSIRLVGLPDFNAGDESLKVTMFDGWFSVPEVDAVLVANGGGAGAVASGPWLSKEATYTLQGYIDTGRATLEAMRRLLIAALPANADTPIVCLGGDLGPDLQVFVRRVSRADYPLGFRLDFTIPLVAVDPYKYALEPLSGAMGVYTGNAWYETFTLDSGSWVETFTSTGGWHETYQQEIPSGDFPASRTLDSPGDVSSQRVIGLAVGPLTAGDWWLLSETTGARLGVALDLAAGQGVTFDCGNRLATLSGGEDVTSAVFGNWLTLEPGLNTYRLISGTQSDAYGGISAWPAYL